MRGVLVVVAVLALAPAAHAACPVMVSRDHGRGAAPRHVPRRVRLEAVPLAPRRRRDGRRQAHRDAHVPRRPVHARAPDRPRRQRLAPVTSIALRLHAPGSARYARGRDAARDGRPEGAGHRRRPALPRRAAAFQVTDPHVTAVADGVAAQATIRVKPILDVRITGDRTIGSPLRVVAVLRPAHAGTVDVQVDGLATDPLDTTRVGVSRIVVTSVPRDELDGGVARRLRARARAEPRVGAHGPRGGRARAAPARARLRAPRRERRLRRRRLGRPWSRSRT